MDNLEFRVGQLTKELVAQKLKSMEDPCAVAAGLVRQTLDVALKSKPSDSAQVAADTCYGAMQGLMLTGQDFPKASVMVLQAVSDHATTVGLDPTDQMMGALKGFAKLSKLCTSEQLHEIKTKIEANFNGAGEAFSYLLSLEQDKTSATP